MHEDLLSFQRRAIVATLGNALKHPLYREKWQGSLDKFGSLLGDADPFDILADLPLTTKSDLQFRLPPALEASDQLASIIFTTGSTGPVTYRYRSAKELREIRRYGMEVVQTVRPRQRRPLAFLLYGPYHGQAVINGVADFAPYYFAGAIWEDIFIRQGVELLQKTFDIPHLESRVTQIHGAVRLLRIFTQALIDMRVNPSEMAVESLVSFAGFLPSETKSFLKAYWNVEPVDIFSMSEMLGGATKCPSCGSLSFDAQLVPHVCALDGQTEVEEGIGRLVLTELLPFGLCQPLVRYYNGDLIRVENGPCSGCGQTRRMIHVGRDNESPIIPHKERQFVALASSDLREAVYCEAVARTVEFPHLKLLKDRESHLGVPLVGMSVDRSASPPKIVVTFKPNEQYLDTSAARVEYLHERLMSTSPELTYAVRNNRVALSVVSDNSFSKPLWK